MSNDINFKVFNDVIHGHISLHPLCVNVIDTPQFQRLRYLKQLGLCYLVFPGATNSRFEHSLGVCHLAGKFCKILQTQQPELKITNVEVLCVELAALCHDLGHGPFSHFWEGYLKRVEPGSDWRHEDTSVDMLQYLVEENNLLPKFNLYGLDKYHITLVGDIIKGNSEPHQSRSFLFQIVANHVNGIDVDKWDYFLRDCHYIGFPTNFDHSRLMEFARVIKVKDNYVLCYRDKEAETVYEMFHTRWKLHRRVYQHRVSKIIEMMYIDALAMANDHITLQGKGRTYKMTEAHTDLAVWTKFNDCFLHSGLVNSNNPALEKAQKILRDIETRNLYAFIGRTHMNSDVQLESVEAMEDELASFIPEESDIVKNDLIIQTSVFNYGMGYKNPIDQVRFYSKSNPNQASVIGKDDISLMLPERFQEKVIRAFSRKNDPESVCAAKQAFAKYCLFKGYLEPRSDAWNLYLRDAVSPLGKRLARCSCSGDAIEEIDQ